MPYILFKIYNRFEMKNNSPYFQIKNIQLANNSRCYQRVRLLHRLFTIILCILYFLHVSFSLKKRYFYKL